MPYRIVYISSSVGQIDATTLADILEQSRRNNSADGITGALLFHDGNFIQILEGPQAEVTACFDRINRDERHRCVIVLESEPVEARIFSSWDMGFVSMDGRSTDQRDNFIDLSGLTSSDKMTEIERDETIAIFMKTFLRGIGMPQEV